MMSGPPPKACPLFFSRFAEMLYLLQLQRLFLIYLFIPEFPGFVIPYSEFAVLFLPDPENHTGVCNQKQKSSEKMKFHGLEMTNILKNCPDFRFW